LHHLSFLISNCFQLRDLQDEFSECQVTQNRTISDMERKIRSLEGELADIKRIHRDEITLLQRETKRINAAAPLTAGSQEAEDAGVRRRSSKPALYDYAEADLNIKPSNKSLVEPNRYDSYDRPASQYDRTNASSSYRPSNDPTPSYSRNPTQNPSMRSNDYYEYENNDYKRPPQQSSSNSTSIRSKTPTILTDDEESMARPASVYGLSGNSNRVNSNYTSSSGSTSTGNPIPSSLGSRTQTLGAVRQSLASVVENTQSLARNYSNMPPQSQGEARHKVSLADMYNSQFENKNLRKSLGGVTPSPFATDNTIAELSSFEEMDRSLTRLMTEKTSLDEEMEK